jgi:hypothetical protein
LGASVSTQYISEKSHISRQQPRLHLTKSKREEARYIVRRWLAGCLCRVLQQNIILGLHTGKDSKCMRNYRKRTEIVGTFYTCIRLHVTYLLGSNLGGLTKSEVS